MREGIYWRGSDRARRRQRECNPNESFVLPSGRQARRNGASLLVGCVILCFLTWTLSRFWTPSPISTESLCHQVPTQAVVFELFRYYRHPQARNRSFTGPVHWRRRGLLDFSETRASAPQEIFSEEEQAEQPFDDQGVDDNLTIEFDSLKKRNVGYHNYHQPLAFNYDQDASSSSLAPIGECPLFGGKRTSDAGIESFFVKVGLGYGSHMREYFLNIDTGSGATWVNCKGRGPIAEVGPNGLFYPKRESFLNCKNNQDLCKDLQDGVEHPCDKMHKFRCLFEYTYGDNTAVQGSVVVGDVSLELGDGSQKHANMAFGCAERVTLDGQNVNVVQQLIPYDGLLGLGPYPGGWLLQLNMLRIVSEYVIAICLEPDIGHLSSGPGSSVLEHVGFISLGDSYTRQAANIVWTATIPPESTDPLDNDYLYSAMLVGFKYRNEVHILEAGVEMGFDTGSDLTYLTRKTFDFVVDILNQDAVGMGYVETPDRVGGVGGNVRNCWQDIIVGRKSSVKHFGDLIMMFSSLGDKDATSDFVIKPEHYITLGGHPNQRRICFNILREPEGDDGFDYGNIGGEAMRGHLLIFMEQPRKMEPSGLIGWRSVTSCKNLR